jgi:hypothetical protein
VLFNLFSFRLQTKCFIDFSDISHFAVFKTAPREIILSASQTKQVIHRRDNLTRRSLVIISRRGAFTLRAARTGDASERASEREGTTNTRARETRARA